jgi:hypothetical protein
MISSGRMITGAVTVATATAAAAAHGTDASNRLSPNAIALGSASSSLSSSSCSSSSYSILNQEAHNHHHHLHNQSNNTLGKPNMHHLYEKQNDSGIEKDDSISASNNIISAGQQNSTIFIRVSITDQNLQKVLKFSLDETVWSAKQRVLGTLAKEVKDGLNYGFYLPPFQGRAGKFLDDCRKLSEYPLNGQIPNLEVNILTDNKKIQN